jgi:hypothetical protein
VISEADVLPGFLYFFYVPSDSTARCRIVVELDGCEVLVWINSPDALRERTVGDVCRMANKTAARFGDLVK